MAMLDYLEVDPGLGGPAPKGLQNSAPGVSTLGTAPQVARPEKGARPNLFATRKEGPIAHPHFAATMDAKFMDIRKLRDFHVARDRVLAGAKVKRLPLSDTEMKGCAGLCPEGAIALSPGF